MSVSRADPVPETLPPPGDAPRLVVFGLRCCFTDGVVAELERHGLPPVAILLPGPPGLRSPFRVQVPRRSLPMAVGETTRRFGSELVRYQIGRPGSAATLGLVHALEPDIIAVACYPRRLPHDLYRIARLAAVNVHPSLLPSHRGPDPLFWTLREGTGEAGVSIHELVEEFDAGPILAQERVLFRDGTTESDLEHELASTGGRLLARTIQRLLDGPVDVVEQPSVGGSYESWPSDNDYVIDTRRSARQAFNFIRGIAERGVPVGVRHDDSTTWVRAAIGWSDVEPAVEPGHVAIRFTDGFLTVEPDGRWPDP